MVPRPPVIALSLLLVVLAALSASEQTLSPQEDQALDQQLQSVAAAHHGKLAVYARNLRTGQTASVSPDLPVKTASTIKLGILLEGSYARSCAGKSPAELGGKHRASAVRLLGQARDLIAQMA